MSKESHRESQISDRRRRCVRPVQTKVVRWRLRAVCMACVLAQAVCPAALAQSSGEKAAGARPVSPQDAEDFFKKGKALAEHRDFAAAYASFKEAWKRRQAYDIAGNLGHTALLLNNGTEAAEYLTFCVENFPASGDPAKRAGSAELLRRARERVFTLRVSIEPGGANVRIDGEDRGSASALPREIFVEAGEHRIEAALDGYENATKQVRGERGSAQAVELVLTKASVPIPHATDLPEPQSTASVFAQRAVTKSSPSLVPALVGGGAALTLVMAGIVLRASASSEERDARRINRGLNGAASCTIDPGQAACAQVIERYDAANRKTNIATASFAAGGVFAVATAAYYLWPRDDRKAEQPTSARLRIQPTATLGTGEARFFLIGNF